MLVNVNKLWDWRIHAELAQRFRIAQQSQPTESIRGLTGHYGSYLSVRHHQKTPLPPDNPSARYISSNAFSSSCQQ
jgi:hypothetical protein